MALINAVRLININYNHNSMKINDEIMHFNGQSTLVSLKNGGGKSVLIQMLMAPFVHKRFRDAKDRPFESYFTSPKPSFILVEWRLDGEAGYLLTGIMVRRSQADIDTANNEPLEMTGIISFYRDPCICDMHHLPVVEKNKKEMILKNYGACRQLFDSYKKDRTLQFFYYDLTMPAQTKQYFHKLKEYKIDHKEWERIIKKVNQEESGLSNLFADCKDERGLVEKWFLETIQEKLNNENDRMAEFQTIVDKHVRQYSENESKIKRRDIIQLFKSNVCEDGEEKSVLTMAKEAVGKEQEEAERQNRIVNYLHILKGLQEKMEQAVSEKASVLEEIDRLLARLAYEQYSYDIGGLEKELKQHSRQLLQLQIEIEDVQTRIEKTDSMIHGLQGAELFEIRQEELRERERLEEKKKLLHKTVQEIEPRRNELGRLLYTCYTKLCAGSKEQLAQKGQALKEREQKIRDKKEDMRALSKEKDALIRKIGGLREKLRAYDKSENDFNERYHEKLARNVLGTYEEGFFEIFQEDKKNRYEKRLAEDKYDRQSLEEKKRTAERLDRDTENARIKKNDIENEKRNWEREQGQLKQELSERRDILKYLELHEQAIFDQAQMLAAADKKIGEKEELIRQLTKETAALEKEYAALTSGKILELPKELDQALEKLEIRIVFGMEWLKKNEKPVEENRALVQKNPFLPYALLMSARDIQKLQKEDTSIYTSLPVPIVARETLARPDDCDTPLFQGQLCSFEGVLFYVHFNENFLDEVQLSALLREKEQQIAKLKQQTAARMEERDGYLEKKKTIRQQRVTKELLQKIEEAIAESDQQLTAQAELIVSLKKEKDENKVAITELECAIREHEKVLSGLQQERQDIEKLAKEYAGYLLYREETQQKEEQLEKTENQYELAETQIEQWRDKILTLNNEKNGLQRELDRYEEHLAMYQSYAKVAEEYMRQGMALLQQQTGEQVWPEAVQLWQQTGEQVKPETALPLQAEERMKLEAEYTALTEQISSETRDLEEQMRQQQKRFEKAEKRLDSHMKKYGITQEQLRDLRYDEEELEHLQSIKEQQEAERRRKEEEKGKENTEIAVIKTRIEEQLRNMHRETGFDTPLRKEELVVRNFEAEKNQLKFKKKGIDEEKKVVEKRLGSYNENIAGLAEYEALPITVELTKESFAREMDTLDGKELTRIKGELVRDYHQAQAEKNRHHEQLLKRLNQLLREEAFEDEYFKKPLEAMVRLADTPEEVIRQIETTIKAYDDLMKKIGVDIDMVENEKKEIVAQLLGYIKEVHENLGKIDSNSTIRLHDRSIKMLKIDLPSWEDNAGMYENRMRECVEDVTLKGVELYRNSENPFNYFGTRINTKNLYDVTVGIANVQIKLFKIEQYREYPITWAEVAKNSGGEGFLSSFVILSSLLYYMRKDESDIFADNNEGKVLLMDNPFAATYSEHLLKPLMEVAKKNNTQLLCLTGLGGDSIYGRFDNIYVLNLVSAGLKRGMQYLRTEHVRGKEPEMMVVSHVAVEEPEQLTLF